MDLHPIIFTGGNVLSILSGQKTQSRRILKAPHLNQADVFAFDKSRGKWEMGETHQGPVAHVGYVRCPYGVPGDRLWVKETFRIFGGDEYAYQQRIEDVRYRADVLGAFEQEVWRPSIYMPLWASRLTLEVLDVRIERLQRITEIDAKAEGVRPFFETFPGIGRDQRLTSGELAADAEHRASYAVLWDEINEYRATWKSNPWVWCLTFRRHV